MRDAVGSTVSISALLLLSLATCSDLPDPPVAKVVPHELTAHGQTRVDNYYWLNQRDDPAVFAYLGAENAYTEEVMRHAKGLQEELFQEITSRIQQDDSTVPYLEDGYYHYERYEEGLEYQLFCRKPGSLDAAEEVVLDVNLLAQGHDYCDVDDFQISEDGKILAFGVDFRGRRFYDLRFKDLTTGTLYDEMIPMTTGNVQWANDNRTVFYAMQDTVTLRPNRILRHRLGSEPAQDEVVFEEDDDTFACGILRTKSDRYLLIESEQTLSTEYWLLDADDPTGTWKVFLPRERNHEYHIDHLGENWFIRTNWSAQNFRLMKCGLTLTGKENWEEAIPHREDVLLEAADLFVDYLVLSERSGGLDRLRVIRWDGTDDHYLAFDEPAYHAYLDDNREIDTAELRFIYTSLTTPRSTYDYDMGTRTRRLLKEQPVLGGFDRNNYVTERIYARVRDGVDVPISLVYRKGFEKNGQAPLLLYGYGSYGYTIDPTFRSPIFSLLDRGFVYAIAHVRGGQVMGRWWYEDGKLLKKKNTFTDFIDCAHHLIHEGYAARDKVFAYGASAGGLLIGAVTNMEPQLWRGIIADVPWVDCVTTMLDPSIPLTTAEYDEWGNPNEKEYYDYILSYSPYDQVEAKDYPNMLVLTGLHDSAVQYFEPTKWVAKLRALKTDNNRLLLRINMSAGHAGASGRFERYAETALIYAFIFDLLGIES